MCQVQLGVEELQKQNGKIDLANKCLLWLLPSRARYHSRYSRITGEPDSLVWPSQSLHSSWGRERRPGSVAGAE